MDGNITLIYIIYIVIYPTFTVSYRPTDHNITIYKLSLSPTLDRPILDYLVSAVNYKLRNAFLDLFPFGRTTLP